MIMIRVAIIVIVMIMMIVGEAHGDSSGPPGGGLSSLSLSHSMYIYIYIYICVCFFFADLGFESHTGRVTGKSIPSLRRDRHPAVKVPPAYRAACRAFHLDQQDSSESNNNSRRGHWGDKYLSPKE